MSGWVSNETESVSELEVTAHQAKVVDDSHQDNSTQKFETTQLTHIIVDCSAVLYVDLMGKDALIDVYNDYKTIDIEVLFANTQGLNHISYSLGCSFLERVRQIFESTDFFTEVPRNRVFVSVSDAVDQAELEQRRKSDSTNVLVRFILFPSLQFSFLQKKMILKPAAEPPIAKSVGQKSAPLGDNTFLPATQSSVSLVTGVDYSFKDSTAKEGAIQRKMKVPSRSSIHWDDLDKTQ